MKDFLVKLFATGLFSGYLKPFPGTWGTVPAWLIAYFLIKGDMTILWPVTIVCTLLSVAFSSLAEKILGHDSRKIVIDEWAGMFISLLYVPYSFSMYASAFIAFRVFDVLKVWPARQSERLPGGVGVTADDIVAGIQTVVFIHLIIYVSRTFFA